MCINGGRTDYVKEKKIMKTKNERNKNTK